MKMTKAKVLPKGGIKIIVLDNNGTPKVLGTIPVWEHPTPAQKWIQENSGAELTAQCVYVDSSEEFTLESELSLQENKTKTITAKYKVKVKEV
jgi:hypothetical protein